MTAFSWLLISDLHLKSEYQTWSQRVVLRDMVRDIANRKKDYPPIKFIIVSGDLAHGGKADQYKLVEAFLNDLINELGLERSDVYVVPGNHDIDRDIRQLAFHGARATFSNAENVEHYLSTKGERETLLERLSAFYDFERRYCGHLDAAYTEDRLAYFTTRLVGALPIGIVGLNSALACGDDKDEHKLVVGDRPVIDVCELIRASDVRLVVGVLHHPPAWLASFDQQTFDARLLPACDILHRGHLHEHDIRPIYTSPRTNCLVIAAGASYFGRQFDNSYSIVSLDSATSSCSTAYFEYESHSGQFDRTDFQKHRLGLRGNLPGDIADLAVTLRSLNPATEDLAPYLAALIEGCVSEIPLPINGTYVFGAPVLLREVEDPLYVEQAEAFLGVRNLLLAFAANVSLADRLAEHGAPIIAFAAQLRAFAKSDHDFNESLQSRISHAAQICARAPAGNESTYVAALKQFAEEGDWSGLEHIARRYILIDDPHVHNDASRYLALALANIDDREKQNESLEAADSLLASADATVTDYELAFMIYRRQGRDARAEQIVLDAIDRFGQLPAAFHRAAMRFAGECGRAAVKLRLDVLGGGKNE